MSYVYIGCDFFNRFVEWVEEHGLVDRFFILEGCLMSLVLSSTYKLGEKFAKNDKVGDGKTEVLVVADVDVSQEVIEDVLLSLVLVEEKKVFILKKICVKVKLKVVAVDVL